MLKKTKSVTAEGLTKSINHYEDDDDEDDDKLLPLNNPDNDVGGSGGDDNDVESTQAATKNQGYIRDAIDTLWLAMTLFISMVSWVAMKTTDSAVLGHIGTDYLAAFAMSDLWTSSSGVFVMGRVLSILCGQALGAGNKPLVGIWFQVSLVVIGLVSIPIIGLWMVTYYVLQDGFQQDHTLSVHAAYYAMVLAGTIPARVVSAQLRQFFTAQRIMRPVTVCSAIGMVVNLLAALVLVLGIPFNPTGKQAGIHLSGKAADWHGFGYLACPIVTVAVEYIQLAILVGVYCSCYGLHKPCWPGWSWSHITKHRVWVFVKLYVPAALTLASDFWRVAVIGVFAARLGQNGLPLAVFNTAYRLCWISMTFVGSVAGAVGIKLSKSIAQGNVQACKQTTLMGTLIVVITLGILSVFTVFFAREIASIFSSDVKVLDAFHDSRIPLTTMIVGMNLACYLEKIPLALGRVKTVLYLGMLGSWGGQVPCVALATHFWRNDLFSVFAGVSVGYAMLCVWYLIAISCLDWHKCVREAQIRSEVVQPTKSTSLSYKTQ